MGPALSEVFDLYYFPTSINGDDIRKIPDFDVITLAERILGGYQKGVPFLDNLADIIGQAQLANEIYSPLSKTIISACSSSLRALAAAVAPPTTPPIINSLSLLVISFH
jgi:hypothetical protein